MIQLKNILVATDFSEPSGIALDYGRDLARSYGATLHVLHVVEDVTMRYAGEIGFAADAQRDMERSACKRMEELVTADDRHTLQVVPVVETHFGTAKAITDYASSNKIDVIVTGTNGRGMIQHLLMGSVAERVVRTAPCPVLTVRAHERDFITPDALCVVGASS